MDVCGYIGKWLYMWVDYDIYLVNGPFFLSNYLCRSEKSTNWGRRISGALTSTLVGLFLSNIGVIASDAPAYTIVNQYLLPLSVPLLLFSADLNVVIASTGRLLLAFCLGSGIFLTMASLILNFNFDLSFLYVMRFFSCINKYVKWWKNGGGFPISSLCEQWQKGMIKKEVSEDYATPVVYNAKE